MSRWILAYDGYDPAAEGLREALCTLGNGYFATRGATPESSADGVHYFGTYIAGCYDRLQAEISGRHADNRRPRQHAELAAADLSVPRAVSGSTQTRPSKRTGSCPTGRSSICGAAS